MSDISEFLELQGQQGTFDSSGVFSIDLEAQVRRLYGQVLQNDSEAVLKLIQALVALGADDIQIRDGHREFSLYGRNANSWQAPQKLDFENLGHGLQADLVYGLAHLWKHEPCRVGFSRWEDGKWVSWTSWLGEANPPRLRRPPNSLQQGIGVHIQFEEKEGCLTISRPTLEKQLFWCPCTVHFEGALLAQDDKSQLETVKGVLGMNSNDCLKMDYYRPWQKDPGRPLLIRFIGPSAACTTYGLNWTKPDKNHLSVSKLRSFGVEELDPSVRFKPEHFGLLNNLLGSSQELVRASGAVYIRSQLDTGSSWIIPVKRGVALAPVAWNSHGGTVLCVLADDELKTALSQFTVAPEEVPKLSDQAVLLLTEAIAEGQRRCEAWTEWSLDRAETFFSGACGFIGMVGGGLSSGPAGAFLGSLVGGATGALIGSWRHGYVYGDTEKREVQSQLEQWRQSLVQVLINEVRSDDSV